MIHTYTYSPEPLRSLPGTVEGLPIPLDVQDAHAVPPCHVSHLPGELRDADRLAKGEGGVPDHELGDVDAARVAAVLKEKSKRPSRESRSCGTSDMIL